MRWNYLRAVKFEPIHAWCVAAIAYGLWLRVYSLGYPTVFLWDETHFVSNARNYLAGQADWNDHPPLGKLLIAASMAVFGDNPVGWRVASLVFGCLLVVVGGVVAYRFFASRTAFFIACALIALDGFHIAYSRAALLDGMLSCLCLAPLAVLGLRASALTSALAGLLIGAAANVKFSGITAIVAPTVAIFLSNTSKTRRVGFTVLMASVATTVYAALYAVGLALRHQPADLAMVIAETERLFAHHAVLTDMKHPATSNWYSWILPRKPIILGRSFENGNWRVLTTLGNPLVWWASWALIIAQTAKVLWHGAHNTALLPQAPPPDPNEAPRPRSFFEAHGRSIMVLVAAGVAALLPWIIFRRDSYIYHFLPSYSAFCTLLAAYLGWLATRYRSWILGILIIIGVVSAFYAPVWTLTPVSAQALDWRLFVNTWR